MATQPKPSKLYLAIAFWLSLASMVCYIGIYAWWLYSWVLHPPLGWERVALQFRYEATLEQLKNALGLLPIVAFNFMLIAYLIREHTRAKKEPAET
jgi:hypothetical protein